MFIYRQKIIWFASEQKTYVISKGKSFFLSTEPYIKLTKRALININKQNKLLAKQIFVRQSLFTHFYIVNMHDTTLWYCKP